MESYIVRVYRRRESDQSPFRGVVERPGAEGQEVFSTMDELWNILSTGNHRSSKGRARNRSKTGRDAKSQR